MDCAKASCRYRTHECLKQSLSTIAKRLGISHSAPNSEPYVNPEDQADRKRLDIELHNVPVGKDLVGTVGVDVTTVNPLAPTRAEEVKQDGRVAQKAAERKMTKYQEEYKNKFIPFVVESTGGWSKHNQEMLAIFGQHAKARGRYFSQWWAKMAIATAHRKEVLYAIHGARETILAAKGCPGFCREELDGIEAKAVHERPVVDG